MTGFVRDDAGLEPHTGEREIAYTVHHLMPHELVWRAKLVLHHAVRVEHHGILRGRALDEPPRPQRLHLLHEPESSRPRQLTSELRRRHIGRVLLPPDQRMREV